MTAKEYLNKVKLNCIKVEHKTKQLQELEEKKFDVQALNLTMEKVKHSRKNYNLSDACENLKENLKKQITIYLLEKDNIINDIHKLKKEIYVEVLYRHYVEYKPLELIAEELNYNYSYIRRKHGEALKEMSIILKSKENENV